MSTERDTILTELRTLAAQRHWSPVITLIDNLFTSQRENISIAYPAHIDPSAVQRWIKECEPNKNIDILPLESLAQDPSPSIKAEKLLAVFKCGTLLGTSETDAIARAFFSRPQGSYAIVMTGAERITQEDELDMLERGLWRLLVPEPRPDWDQQDLSTYGCYLWNDGEPETWLHARLQRDRQVLMTWLHHPLPCAMEFKRMQMLYALDLAEDFISQSTPSPTEDEMQHSIRQLEYTREMLLAQKRRLFRRIDDAFGMLERQLTTSLLSLEQDLLYNLPVYLQQCFPRSAPGISANHLKALIIEYITTNASTWEQQSRRSWQQRIEEIDAEIGDLLYGVDWETINAIVAEQGGGQTYPDTLMQRIPAASNLSGVNTDGVDIQPASLKEDIPLQTSARSSMVGVLTGSGVLAVATLFLGFGPVQLVAAGAAAMLGGMLTKGRLERGQQLQLAERYARTTVNAVIHEAISQVQELIQQAHTSLRNYLTQELRAVERILGETYQRTQLPAKQAEASNTDLQLIETYRRKVATAETS